MRWRGLAGVPVVLRWRLSPAQLVTSSILQPTAVTPDSRPLIDPMEVARLTLALPHTGVEGSNDIGAH